MKSAHTCFNRLVICFLLLFSKAIVFSQNVGIGTTTPLTRLHVADSIVLFSAAGNSTTAGNLPVSGVGRRLIWYPQKAAFRVGAVSGTQWDTDSIGAYSFAAGGNTTALGGYSVALGNNCKAAGFSSVAIGIGTKSMGNFSLTLGYNTEALGESSTAFGYSSKANENYSTAMGYYTSATGVYSTAMGYYTTASGFYSTALGFSTTASGSYSIALGNGTSASGTGSVACGYLASASGLFSTATGRSISAKAYASFSLGAYNDDADNPDPAAPNPDDRIFQIGNGDYYNKGNAITVLRNGNVGVGVLSPASRLDIKGSNWDLSNTEGDMRIGDNNYRIKFGIATAGGGAGDARIMQYGQTGGYNVLALGSQGNSILYLVGNLNRAGIGTNNPSEKLEVAGNVRASAFLTTSDLRLKTNITPIKSSLANLLLLNAYSFNWKDKEMDSTKQIGLIAQEIQNVYPDLVHKNENGELSVNYSGMIPLLLNAIKEQQEEIEELKTEVKHLKQRAGKPVLAYSR